MKAYGGFNGGRRKQGGWVGLAIGGLSLASSLFGGGGSGGGPGPQQAEQLADPYAAYRGQAAQQLQQLMANPSSIQNTPTYQAYLQAAQRQSAAQGYTGSGNALAAAAQAGGAAYQQQFNNLAMLSGADWTGGANAASLGMQAGNQNAQNIGNSLGMIGNSLSSGSAGSDLSSLWSLFGSGGSFFSV